VHFVASSDPAAHWYIHAPVYGRDEEIRSIAMMLAGTTPHGAALLTGTAGSGMTSVIRSALAALGETPTIEVTFEQGDEQTMLGAVYRAWRAAGTAPPAVGAAVLGGRDPWRVDRRADIASSVADAMLTPRNEQPALIVLEHIEYLDDVSAIVLRKLLRRVAPGSARLVVTTADPQHPSTRMVMASDRVVVVGIGPLPVDAVNRTAADIIGAPVDQRTRALLASAQGHALTVAELLAEGCSTGWERVETDPSLPGVINRRLARQSSDERHLLRTVAALGPDASVDDLAAVAGLPLISVANMLEHHVGAGLLAWRGTGVGFRHSAVRSIVAEATPAGVKVALHLGAARHYRQQGAVAASARHFVAAGDPAGPESVDVLAAAGRELLPVFPQQAVQLLAHALTQCPSADARRGDIARDHVEALLWLGRLHEAERAARDEIASPWTSAERSLELHVGLGWTLLAQSRVLDAGDCIRTLSAAGALCGDRHYSASALTLAGYLALATGDSETATQHADAALALNPDSSSEPWVGTAARSLRALLALRSANLVAAREWCMAARSVQEQLGEAGVRWPISVVLAQVHLHGDDLVSADLELARSRRLAEEFDSQWTAIAQRVTQIVVDSHAGRWDRALAETATLRVDAEATGFDLASSEALAEAALIHIHRDELDEAERCLVSLEASLQRRINVRVDLLLTGRAALHLAHGRVDETIELLLYGWAVMHDLASAALGLPDLASRLVPLLVQHRPDADVRTICERAASASGALGPTAQAQVAMCSALAEHDPVRARQAVELARTGCSPEVLAWALEVSASLPSPCAADATGVADDRVAALTEALQVWAHLGARHDERRVRALLRDLGVRTSIDRSRTRGSSNPRWDLLTTSEQDVAALVADGLSNREIAARRVVSIRTVESQMAAIRSKLGVTRRSEVAALVRRMATRSAR